MRMNDEHHLLDGGLKLHGNDALGDELRGLRADDMDAQNLAVLRIGDDFYKAIVRIDDGGFGVAHERELADLHLLTLLFGLDFCEADATDLRVAVGAAGNAIFPNRQGVFARQFARYNDATHRANVSELR